MRVLVVTKIFPNAAEPSMAPYNRLQLGALAKLCDVEVLALVPWFPGRGRRGVPARERIDALDVLHPRVLYAPGPGRPLSGALYTASLVPHALMRRGRVDVVLGCFAYPDGWAAVALGKMLGVPAVVKVHGSDIHVYGHDRMLTGALRWALSRAAFVVGPSEPLVARAIELGAQRALPILNGVDTAAFYPRDRQSCRALLGHAHDTRRWIVFAGRVEPQKGVLELIAAFRAMRRDDVALVLVGAERERVRQTGIITAGARPPEEMPLWIGAADVCTLPSWSEGTPNFVLESLASGRRVVATNVGGIPAVLSDPALGELVPAKDPLALRDALERALAQEYEPSTIVERAQLRSWDESARELHGVLRAARGAN
ncbi:MAG TPA: glycosyltransferase [Polyangiaceae bacterium]|jgi:glycosyltransferase involved in cell wall biosynthesis|nr:glycosyltransferase [Polyangiaceae bacterium]